MKKKTPLLTPLQRILNLLSILLCVSAFVYTIIVYPSLPDEIPSHYDASGNITSYNGKSMLIVLCFIELFIIALPLTGLSHIKGLADITNAPFRIPKGQEGALSSLTRTLLCCMNITLTAMFSFIIFSSAQCKNLPGLSIWLPMVILAALLVWYCIRCYQLSKQPKEWEPWDD